MGIVRRELTRLQRDTALMWFKYMNAQDVVHLLGYLAERADHSSAIATSEIIEAVLVISSEKLSQDLDATTRALPLLCRLQAHVPQSTHLMALIASATQGSLPLAYDGFLPPAPPFSEWTVHSLTSSGDKRWALRLQPAPSISVDSLLSGDNLPDSAVAIVTSLLYRERSARSSVLKWLSSPASKGCSTMNLVEVLFALYDTSRRGDSEPEDLTQAHFQRIVKVVMEARHSREVCLMASRCMVSMVAASHSRAKYLKVLSKEITSTAPEQLRPYVLLAGTEMLQQIGSDVHALVEELLDLGLKWAVRHFAESESSSDDDRRILSSLGMFCSSACRLLTDVVSQRRS